MTRDSKILPVLQVSAIILALVVANITNPSDWGLSPIALRWIGLLSTVIGTVAGFLSTSPLKGENDAAKVNVPTKLPLVLLALAIGSVSLTGCAAKAAPAQMPTVPAVVAAAPGAVSAVDKDVNAAAIKALGIIGAAGVLVEKVVDVEKNLQPVIPAAQHAQFQTAARALATQSLAAIDAIEHGAAIDWPSLKAKIDPIVARAGELLAVVQSLPSLVSSRFGFSNLISSLVGIVGQLSGLGAFHGTPVPIAGVLQ